ncbi:hypothetical protein AB0M58_14480 [Streptomyces bobili]|uniref:hypothetical protein n=1 Tax=Streptomyces bobili TaxID=67280 RepID=UPI00342D1586
MTGVVRDPQSSAEPHPATSSTAPSTPSLSPTQEPTPSAPNPDPTTSTPCNICIFDPECSGMSDRGTTSGITGGIDV